MSDATDGAGKGAAPGNTNRRRFLVGAAAVTAGAAGLSVLYDASAQPKGGPGVQAPGGKVGLFRTLGRTGLSISAVGVGAGGISDPGLLARAVDKGINYVDTAICYGDSEEVIGRALAADKGLRKKLVIATKWDSGAAMPKDRIVDSLDKSLKRLGVDFIDVMQVHWLGGGHLKDDTGFNRLDNPELYAAMEAAKKAGKVRFFGATSHHDNRSKILQHAIDKGVFDMILVKMNVLDFDKADIPALLAKAKAKNVGVVAMKSQPEGGAIPPGFEKSKLDVYQANLRWCLSHDVASVVHSAIGTDAKMQDLAIGVAQEKVGGVDDAPHGGLLERYAAALSPDYCRECAGGEGSCQAACPAGVAIDHVLHLRMYDRRLGWHDYAKRLYHELPEASRWSEACTTCNACTDACSYGVDAAGRVRDAKRSLG